MTPNHLKTREFANEVSVESKGALTLIPKLNPLAVIMHPPTPAQKCFICFVCGMGWVLRPWVGVLSHI